MPERNVQDRLNQLDSEQREFYFAKLSNTNQLSKNEKIEFWNEIIKTMLMESTAVGKKTTRFTLTPSSLKKAFSFGSMKQEPACIFQVLHILQKEEAIVDASKQDTPFLKLSGIFSVIRNLLVGPYNDDHEGVSEKSFPQVMLHKELLDQSCVTLMKYIKSKNQVLMDEINFVENVKAALDIDIIDDSDLKIIEKELISQNRLLIEKHASITAYKFQTNPASVMVPVSEIEFGQLSLNRTCISLTNQISEMNENIDSLKIEIKQALQEKAKQKALFHLKRVKMLSDIVEKRSKSLFTIEQIIEKINSAETEEKILQAYSVGSKALQSIISRTSIDKVQNTMDELEDVLADHREIDMVMMQSQEEIVAASGWVYDENELEKELDALMEMEKPSKVDDDAHEMTVALQNLPLPSKEIPSITQKMVSPSPLLYEQSGATINRGRRTLNTIHQFEKSCKKLEKEILIIYKHVDYVAPPSIHSGRTSRIDAYVNQSPQPASDFFWEARMAGANRDRDRLPHQSPVPSHGSHGVSNIANQQQIQSNDTNSVRYTRVKTDIREYDPDADLKMRANRQWKESIEKQIEENKMRDLLEKQKEEREDMRIAKTFKDQQEYPASNLAILKPIRKEPPMVYLGPIPDILHTQKAYSVSKNQMKENSKIPRFRRELFQISGKDLKNAQEKPPVEVIIVSPNETIMKTSLKKKPLPVIRPPQKSLADKKHEEELAGFLPGSCPNPPRNYIPKKSQQSHNGDIVIPVKASAPKELPPISSASESKKVIIKTANAIPKISTINLPNEAVSTKSPPSHLDPRSPNKAHQRVLRGEAQNHEMERLKEENLQQLSELKRVLEEKRMQFVK